MAVIVREGEKKKKKNEYANIWNPGRIKARQSKEQKKKKKQIRKERKRTTTHILIKEIVPIGPFPPEA